MIKKNTKFIGKVLEINNKGLGVLKYNNKTVLVKDVLLNEVVEVSIVKKIKEGYFAKVLKIKEKSSKRCKIKCSVFKKCGGCNNLHILYPFELNQKQNDIQQLLKKHRLKAKVMPVMAMDEPYGYRNKCILTFRKNKLLEAGFYESGSHRLVNVENCLLHDDFMNSVMTRLKKVVSTCKLDIYDERYNRGFLKYIQIRQGSVSSELLITLITNTKEFRGKKNFINVLLKEIPEVTSVVQNVNSRQTSVVLGNEEYVLYGKGYIVDELCGLKFRISSKSFYQINHQQCERLYNKAIALLDLDQHQKIIDTYCGIGTMSLISAKKCKSVIGVEINRDAVNDAKNNAKLNGVKNVEFVCDDASNYMQKLAYQETKIDGVIMDPTREGSTIEFMDALMKLAPTKVVYISCNPKTQMRDLRYLSKMYEFKEVYPVDMFPRTEHVESLVLMVKKDK